MPPGRTGRDVQGLQETGPLLHVLGSARSGVLSRGGFPSAPFGSPWGCSGLSRQCGCVNVRVYTGG